MEFAARVAELTKAGLPLGAGLRALADELPAGRLPHVLHRMADRLDAGDDLMAVLESHGATLPGHLRGLMLAGVRSGRLAEVLEQFVDLQQSQLELRRRVTMALAYPFFLLLVIAGLGTFTAGYVVPSFTKIFQDFGTTLPALTLMIIHGSRPAMWLLLGLVGLSAAVWLLFWLSPVPYWVWPMLHRLPMVGPLLRWRHLAQFARLMALLLEQKVAIADALHITAAGLRDARLARACRDAAHDIQQGRPLDQCLAVRRPFPASLIPMIQWGQRAPALSDAFRAAAEMFEGRVRTHGTLLEAMLLPVVLVAVLIYVGLFVVAMFLPLISLIQKLS